MVVQAFAERHWGRVFPAAEQTRHAVHFDPHRVFASIRMELANGLLGQPRSLGGETTIGSNIETALMPAMIWLFADLARVSSCIGHGFPGTKPARDGSASAMNCAS
jgi:hypothetical protein